MNSPTTSTAAELRLARKRNHSTDEDRNNNTALLAEYAMASTFLGADLQEPECSTSLSNPKYHQQLATTPAQYDPAALMQHLLQQQQKQHQQQQQVQQLLAQQQQQQNGYVLQAGMTAAMKREHDEQHQIQQLAQHQAAALAAHQQQMLAVQAAAAGLGMGGEQDAKKVKLDAQAVALNGIPVVVNSTSAINHNTGANNTTPSRVVHLRNIPGDMTDMELLQHCVPCGRVTNFLLMRGKNQAFVEFEDEQSATNLIAILAASPTTLRGRTLFAQYSTYQALKLDRTQSGTNGLPNGGHGEGASSPRTGATSPTSQSLALVSSAPNQVLRVIIENMVYPVTLDVLHQIFARYGKVLRIITFSKNNTFQVLIQFSESIHAQQAKTALEGQNVYNGCCTLRIEYSKLATLNIKYNNDKSRDYTNPNLPSGELTIDHPLLAAAGITAGASAATMFGGTAAGGIGGAAATAQAQQQLLAAALATQQLLAAQQSGSAAQIFSQLGQTSVPGLASPNALLNGSPLSRIGGGVNAAAAQMLNFSPVVLVSGLNEEKVSCDALFTLFGVYGDVQRVKILYNKKDNALIQFAEASQAQLAQQHLDKIRLWDRQIHVNSSKHLSVQMPKEGQPDAGLTKDYSQSSLHRFKKPGSKNYMNIYPPSATLHLSNIPPTIDEDELVKSFADASFAVKQFKFFPKDHKMALVQLNTVDEAIHALLEFHNFKLADNAHLRVSFSKTGI